MRSLAAQPVRSPLEMLGRSRSAASLAWLLLFLVVVSWDVTWCASASSPPSSQTTSSGVFNTAAASSSSSSSSLSERTDRKDDKNETLHEAKTLRDASSQTALGPGDRVCATSESSDVLNNDNDELRGAVAENDDEEKDAPRQNALKRRACRDVVNELRDLYQNKLRQIERRYFLHSFLLPKGGEIQDAEFDANPMVLLLGQYSTGKTTFIRHLIGNKDFPGMHIGPEPTTDKFIALVYGNGDNTADIDSPPDIAMQQQKSDELSEQQQQKQQLSDQKVGNDNNIFSVASANLKRMQAGRAKRSSDKDDAPFVGKIIKGNSLTVIPELPFSSLASFGSSFLNHFEASVLPAPLLNSITLIDTPGILSGEKQRIARDYDFARISRWFADRADLILLLFDAHKLDISDELRDVITLVRPNNDDKIRCVLNKADQVNREQLMRVYGSLMWSMGKIFLTPENVRVYVGSFHDHLPNNSKERYVNKDFKEMMERDESLLIDELENLVTVAAERKVNEMVKRVRVVKVHVCILSRVRNSRPLRRLWRRRNSGIDSVPMDRLRSVLENMFKNVKVEYSLSEGDMPKIDAFAEKMIAFSDLAVFPNRLDRRVVKQLDDLIQTDIPKLMKNAGGVEIGQRS